MALYCYDDDNLKDLDISGCPNLIYALENEDSEYELLLTDALRTKLLYTPRFFAKNLVLNESLHMHFHMRLPVSADLGQSFTGLYGGENCGMTFVVKDDDPQDIATPEEKQPDEDMPT